MSMDDFMRSLSDQQKAMFMAALQDSGTPPVKNEEDEDKWTTTMPPHIKEEMEPEPAPEPPAKPVNEFAMRQQRRSGAVQATGANSFSDTGQCKGADYATPNYTPSPRTRQQARKVDVRCHACGKTFQKLESLVTSDYHRCDRCCGG